MHMNLINKRLQEYIEVERETSSQILERLTFYIYQVASEQHDLHIIAKILSEDSISKLVSYFDGDTLKLPTKQEYKEARLLAVTYFLREIQQWSWGDVKEFLNFSELEEEFFSSISLGKKIKTIRESIIRDVIPDLQAIPSEDLQEILHNYLERIENDQE